MNEIILKNKKNGMAVLIVEILLYLASTAGMIYGAILENTLGWIIFGVSVTWISLGWILSLGLKVLGPQEALVLTLFGKYIGTIKEPGFYFVNPFCVAVNPAAKTKLNQSGDVASSASKVLPPTPTSISAQLFVILNVLCKVYSKRR